MRKEEMSVRKRESAKKVVKVLDKVLKLEANSTSCLTESTSNIRQIQETKVMRRIRNSIINWLIKNSAISEENRELYEYAVYSAELLVLPVIMAIVIGWLSGSTVNGIMLIIPFMFLKKYSGGYHAKKLSICMIISTILLTAMIKMSICDIKPAYMYITTCIAFIELCIVSPIQSDNKILNEKETRYYKKVVVMQLAAYSIIIICSSILNCMIVTKCICLGIILASLMQLPCIVTRRTSIR